MEKNVFDFNSFNNCLRIFVQPNHFEDEQIAEIVSFCKKYQFKNVMLFINAEEFNWGHIIKEESAPVLAVMKKAKKIFHENGISFGLNPWMEMGHLARGRTLKEGQNFTTMVDMYGKRSELVACPLDEEWRKYYFDILTYHFPLQSKLLWLIILILPKDAADVQPYLSLGKIFVCATAYFCLLSKYTSLAWTDNLIVGSLLLWIWFCRIDPMPSLFLSLCTYFLRRTVFLSRFLSAPPYPQSSLNIFPISARNAPYIIFL